MVLIISFITNTKYILDEALLESMDASNHDAQGSEDEHEDEDEGEGHTRKSTEPKKPKKENGVDGGERKRGGYVRMNECTYVHTCTMHTCTVYTYTVHTYTVHTSTVHTWGV